MLNAVKHLVRVVGLLIQMKRALCFTAFSITFFLVRPGFAIIPHFLAAHGHFIHGAEQVIGG
jgi:hypothetical protein